MAANVYHYETMRTARLLITAAGLFGVLTAFAVPLLYMSGGSAIGGAAVLLMLALVLLTTAANHAADAGLYFEHTTRRTFRGVAERKGLTKPDGDGGTLYPRFGRLIGNRDAWHAHISPLTGQSLGDFVRAAEAFYTAFGSRTVRFVDNGDGTIMMRVGQFAGSVVQTVIPSHTMTPEPGQSWRDVLSAVPVGQYLPVGGRYRMPAIDTQILVAGVTGAGKGSVIWSLLINLMPAIRAGVVRVTGLDPKRNELSLGRAFFEGGYACSDDDMLKLLQDLVRRMQERADQMAGKVRKFVPSPSVPLEVIVIDELAYLTSYVTDRKQRDAIAKLISTLLSQGRSSGFLVLAAVQDPRVETVPFRDLFPTRIGMKLPAGMIDIILGPGSREAGAACDQIRRKVDAGMAFVISEESDAPELVRFDWSDDDTILAAAASLDGSDGE